MEEFQIDGFRFDGITSMLFTHHGLNYGFTGNYDEYFNSALDIDSWCYLTLANFLLQNFKDRKISIAEDVSGFPGLCRPISEGGTGFDYRLNMYIPDMWIKIIKTNNWKISHIIHSLKNKRKFEKVINYCESHDQALVGDKTIAMRLFSHEIYTNMSIINKETHNIFRSIFLHKFIRFITLFFGDGYMNFMGNEFGHPEWIDFPRKGNNWSYKYCRRQWSLKNDNNLRYKFLDHFDKQMLILDEKYFFLGEEEFYFFTNHEENKIFFLERDHLLLVFNLNEEVSYEKYDVECFFKENERLRIVFDSDRKDFGGHGRLDDAYGIDFLVREKVKEGKNGVFTVYLPSLCFFVMELVN